MEFIRNNNQRSDYNWANITVGDEQIGKIRSKIAGNTITIFSMRIYPEFGQQRYGKQAVNFLKKRFNTIVIYPRYRGHGYGKKAITYFKRSYDTVIADNVTKQATPFWRKMNFTPIEKWRKWDYI